VGCLARDPQGGSGEFALMVRSDRQQRGLGHRLLQALVDAASAQGLKEIWGDVAYDNHRMLAVAKGLGFKAEPGLELGQLRVVRPLDGEDLASAQETRIGPAAAGRRMRAPTSGGRGPRPRGRNPSRDRSRPRPASG
jgi:GNAT superfamily N-acetyltransferase